MHQLRFLPGGFQGVEGLHEQAVLLGGVSNVVLADVIGH